MARYSAGSVGTLESTLPSELPVLVQTTVVKISIVWNKPVITLRQSDMAR